jgi:GNAT superfamily N-acetyltransferase
MALLHISDVEGGKILYVQDEGNEINPYFYANPEEISDEEIYEDFEDIISDENEFDPPQKIGHITVADEDSEIWLDHVEVDNAYQGNGIGTHLVRLAIDYLHLTHVACVKENGNYTYDLTVAGERLIAGCIKKGIVSENMCIFSGDERLRLESATSDDPGYNSVIVGEVLEVSINSQHSHYNSLFSDSDDGEEFNERAESEFEETLPSNLSTLLTSNFLSMLFEPSPSASPLEALQEMLVSCKKPLVDGVSQNTLGKNK